MTALRPPAKVLLLACAGLGTFYLTARLASSQSEASVGLELATPRRSTVPRPDSLAPAPSPASPAVVAVAQTMLTPASGSAIPPGLPDRAGSIPRSEGDPFARLSWLPPPPPPPPPSPPPPPPLPKLPVTPALPFTFVGLLESGAGKPAAFLAKGDSLLIVSVGDLIENQTYRVDVLNEKEVVMTYMPMNTRQTLSVGGSSR